MQFIRPHSLVDADGAKGGLILAMMWPEVSHPPASPGSMQHHSNSHSHSNRHSHRKRHTVARMAIQIRIDATLARETRTGTAR